MTILITGAGGQLGLDCTKVLGSGSTVHGCTSRELDITDSGQVKQFFAQLRPEIVVNCGAYTAVDRCESDRKNCWRVNAEGPRILAQTCHETGVRLIHISTDYVFDGEKPVPTPYFEKDEVNPVSQYGASKLAGEDNIRERLDNHVILRTAWLYGTGGPNFFKTMLRLALADPERTIRVVNDQHGSFTWTWRLANQIQELLFSDTTGTFHATAEEYTTWFAGAKLFLETMDVPFSLDPCTTADYPTPAKRPHNSILENSRLKKHNLNRMVPWQEDVIRFADTFRAELLSELR